MQPCYHRAPLENKDAGRFCRFFAGSFGGHSLSLLASRVSTFRYQKSDSFSVALLHSLLAHGAHDWNSRIEKWHKRNRTVFKLVRVMRNCCCKSLLSFQELNVIARKKRYSYFLLSEKCKFCVLFPGKRRMRLCLFLRSSPLFDKCLIITCAPCL